MILIKIMKHTFWHENAERVLELIIAQDKIKKLIIPLANLAVQNLSKHLHKKTIASAFIFHFASIFADNNEQVKLSKPANFRSQFVDYSLFARRRERLNEELKKLSENVCKIRSKL